MSAVAAIDLGATSGRVVTGALVDGVLRLDHVARFLNTPVRTPDGLHWDVLALWQAAMTGLGEAGRRTRIASAGIDSWAVDYGLLRDGRLVGNPYHYRDARSDAGVAAVHRAISAEELWRRNGLQHLPFNTVFQLAADAAAGALEPADGMLLVPDLLGSWASGARVAERTNASTTGLLSVATGGWDEDLLRRLALPASLLPPLVDPGTDLGPIMPAVRDAFGIADGMRLTAVGSHDTASAVVGTPLGDDAAYLSCGTWSLVGVELPAPVLSEQARAAGFTNEGGVDGRVRFLKNVMGLWVLSETLRTWERRGDRHDLPTLLEQAEAIEGEVPAFDANDPRLLPPGDMPARIADLLREGDAPVPDSAPALVRSILQSLANAYRDAVEDAERLTGRLIRTIHLVGGGAQNALLRRLTADTTGRTVLAGPVEATAIGNLLVQLRTTGALTGDLESLRAVVARSFPSERSEPRSTARRD